MLGCLSLSRWGLSLFSSLLLIIFIPIIATLLDIGTVITNRQYVTNLVDSSGIYQNGVNMIIDSIADKTKNSNPDQQQSQNNENQSNDNQNIDKFITQDELKTSINKIIDKDFLQKNGDLILNSIYDYLEGKTLKPIFTIDLTPLKQNANTVINDLLTSKITALPICKSTKIPKNFDVMNTDCLPKGINMTDINNQINTETAKIDLFSTNSFSSNDLKIDENMLKQVQFFYGILKYLPIVFLVLLILLILSITFIAPHIKIGLIISSISLIISGLILIGITLFGNVLAGSFISEQLNNNKDLSQNIKTTIQNNADILLKSIYDKNMTLAYMAIGLGILTIVGIVIFSILKKKRTGGNSPVKDLEVKPTKGIIAKPSVTVKKK